MKRFFLLSLSTLLIYAASAQDDFKDCGNQKLGSVTEWQACVAGKQIPRFKEKTIAGEKLRSENLKGKILVINFWFTACPPCVAEIPALNKLREEYDNKNIRFLSVTFDDKWTVGKFLKRLPFNFDNIVDASFTRDAFGIRIYPTTFVIDQNGVIANTWVGGSNAEKNEQAYQKIKPVLDQLLKQSTQ